MPSYGFDKRPIDPDKLRKRLGELLNITAGKQVSCAKYGDDLGYINYGGVLDGLGLVYDELSDQNRDSLVVEDTE